ncbi:MAG: hypothetical protein HY301_10955 [Verrucomicrobia bacterium]|nr:hypothetical protein [Verrucomicrobiota bacterium]
MTNTTLELTEAAVDLPDTPEIPCSLSPEAEAQIQTTAALASRKSWKSRLAAWFLPPLCVGAIFMVGKVVMLVRDLFAILNALYVSLST